MGTMHVLCDQGDITVEWDADDPESVERAKAEWERLKDDGYEFFEPVEAKGKRVTKFNAKLGRVIAAPGVKKADERKSGKRQGAMAGGPNASTLERSAFTRRPISGGCCRYTGGVGACACCSGP